MQSKNLKYQMWGGRPIDQDVAKFFLVRTDTDTFEQWYYHEENWHPYLPLETIRPFFTIDGITLFLFPEGIRKIFSMMESFSDHDLKWLDTTMAELNKRGNVGHTAA